jgi:uncharacterized protein (TIGR02265 family)
MTECPKCHAAVDVLPLGAGGAHVVGSFICGHCGTRIDAAAATAPQRAARDESVTVKGSPVRSLQKFIDAELTPAQREMVYSSLPPQFASRMRGPVLATETIPIWVLNEMAAAAAKAKGEPLEQFARRAGREAANDAVKGIYRFFALTMTPASLLTKASTMWSTLNNRGTMSIGDRTDQSAKIELLDYPSEAAHCARVTGWIERMAELTGANDVRVEQTQCYSKGAAHCAWTVRWQ